MKIAIIILAVAVIALATILAWPHSPDISRLDVSELDGSVTFENLGTTDYVIFVRYPSGADERIVLNAGQTYALRNRPQPVEISAASNP